MMSIHTVLNMRKTVLGIQLYIGLHNKVVKMRKIKIVVPHGVEVNVSSSNQRICIVSIRQTAPPSVAMSRVYMSEQFLGG